MFDIQPPVQPESDEPDHKPSGRKDMKGKQQTRRVKTLHPVIQGIKHRETGMGAQHWQDVKERYPNNPIKQVTAFFGGFRFPAAIGRMRKVSLRTQEDYQTRILTFVRTLREMNMPVRNLDEISKKQVGLYFLHMEKEGMSPVWMANVNTAIRRLGIWIGKPDLCPPLGDIVEQPWSAKRRIAADKDRTWGEDKMEHVISEVTAMCPMTGLHLRLARLFGHRVQEFLMFRPAEAVQGDYIHLREGTKGGRARMMPIETDEQRKWINVAIDEAAKRPFGRLMVHEGMTLQKAIRHCYYVLEQCGITKKSIGLTAHGLRHTYACELYEVFTGEKAPIQGGGTIDPDLDNQARLEIARRLGHGRVSITNAYLGSHAALAKYARDNLKKIETQVKADDLLQSMMARSGLRTLCLVGPIASGATLGKSEIAVLAYAAKPTEGESQQEADRRLAAVAMDLADRLSMVLRRHFTVASLARLGEQPDQFELL